MYVCFACQFDIPVGEWQWWTCIGYRAPGPGRHPVAYVNEYQDVLGNWWHARCNLCKIRILENEIYDLRVQLTDCGRHLREAEYHVRQAVEYAE